MSDEGISLADPRSLSNEQLLDLLKTTTENNPWDGQLEMLQTFHDYPICNQWFQKDRVQFDGGTSIVREVSLDDNGTAKFVRPWTPKAVSNVDLIDRIRANWTAETGDYSISREETLRNRGRAKLIDLLERKRLGCMGSMCNKLEAAAWKAPTSSSDDLNPLGIPYSIVPITGAQVTAGTGGTHQGACAVGFTDCYGIDPTVNTKWKNYNDVWSNSSANITDADVVKITQMLRKLRFRSPTYADKADNAGFSNMRLYAGDKLITALEERARKNNDNLGNDIGRFANAVTIANLPVLWNEQTDSDTSNPLYAINHDYFFPFVMDGDFFRETGPMNSRDLHNVFTTHVDLQFNFICTNRQRAGGVISYVSAG